MYEPLKVDFRSNQTMTYSSVIHSRKVLIK